MQNNEKDLKEMDENFEDSMLKFPYIFENHTFLCRMYYNRPSNSFEMMWHLGCTKFSRNNNLITLDIIKLNDEFNLAFHTISSITNISVLLISSSLFIQANTINEPKTYTFYMSSHHHYILRMFFAKPNRLWRMEYF